jgi:hypothetical protein
MIKSKKINLIVFLLGIIAFIWPVAGSTATMNSGHYQIDSGQIGSGTSKTSSAKSDNYGLNPTNTATANKNVAKKTYTRSTTATSNVNSASSTTDINSPVNGNTNATTINDPVNDNANNNTNSAVANENTNDPMANNANSGTIDNTNNAIGPTSGNINSNVNAAGTMLVEMWRTNWPIIGAIVFLGGSVITLVLVRKRTSSEV